MYILNPQYITYQWRRKAWRKADKPSITSKIPIVKTAQPAKTKYRYIEPEYCISIPIPPFKTIVHKTSDNS